MLYAEIAVEAGRAVERDTYTYLVPDGVEVVPGHRVWVPFGRRSSAGYVVALHTDDPGREVRPVERADGEPLLLPHQMELARQVAEHYWAPLLECLRAMLPPRIRRGRSSGAGPSQRQTRHSRLLDHAQPRGPAQAGPALSDDQRKALDAIEGSRRTLLHGVTASGKTEVYVTAAAEALASGLRVLVLVPEIALTPQLVERFAARLGVPLAVLHSGLTELERAQQWWRVRRGDVELVIGSRSAVFAPIPRLGLICLDEEGSTSYKQDRLPRYEAGWVARRLAEVTGARLVLGSATPSVATYHEAVQGGLTLATLPRRVVGKAAEIELVDMREEARRRHRLPLSRRLLEVVDGALRNEEQAILFLNRRGGATYILCRECGRSVECPQCSVSMVQHPELAASEAAEEVLGAPEGGSAAGASFAGGGAGGAPPNDGWPAMSPPLVCHYCGYVRPMPPFCPSCGSHDIRGLGMGTQRLEGVVRRVWPEARVLRLDSDATRRPDAYYEILEAFTERRADLLIGTQLVARGLDLEAVTTVGVVDADLPLHFPDYRSAEATYALVTQVAGRAGRNRRPAHVVVQTSNPDHYSLRAACEGDYAAFYAQEVPARQVFEFPPFAELAVLTHSHEDPDRSALAARDATDELASALVREDLSGIRVLGPSPAFLHRLRGEYRWQITLKGEGLGRVRPYLPRGRGWVYDVDPVW